MGLKDKAARIDFAAIIPQPPSSDSADAAARPKTAPGLMMAQANEQRSELLRENDDLRERAKDRDALASRVGELQDELKVWDGAKAARLLDPKLITRSRWANRDEAHFVTADFQQLKSEIISAGGNVQPIKVRQLSKPDPSGPLYELVFGHRRHQACLESGLPVLAVVDNLDERGLFVEMDRENRFRADLSPLEQGRIYRRALDEGLFPSMRKLADAVGADAGNVAKALALASLPREVVDAFPSPFDLQYRWSKPLADSFAADPDGVLKRAADLAVMNPKKPAKVVFECLTQAGSDEAGNGASIDVQVDGKPAASVSINGKGQVQVSVRAGLVPASRLSELASVLETFLSRKTAKRG